MVCKAVDQQQMLRAGGFYSHLFLLSTHQIMRDPTEASDAIGSTRFSFFAVCIYSDDTYFLENCLKFCNAT